MYNPNKFIKKYQTRLFGRRKTACGSREDLNRANTSHTIQGTSFLLKKKVPAATAKTSTQLILSPKSQEHYFCSKKAPAAAGKTSTQLILSPKSQERYFCSKKNPCGSREDLNRANTCYKLPRTSVLPEKKKPAAAGKTSTELPPQNGKAK